MNFSAEYVGYYVSILDKYTIFAAGETRRLGKTLVKITKKTTVFFDKGHLLLIRKHVNILYINWIFAKR